jgi:hypothetical protein
MRSVAVAPGNDFWGRRAITFRGAGTGAALGTVPGADAAGAADGSVKGSSYSGMTRPEGVVVWPGGTSGATPLGIAGSFLDWA